MVTSSTYRQSSRADEDSDRADPKNELLHKCSIRRLEAEAVRVLHRPPRPFRQRPQRRQAREDLPSPVVEHDQPPPRGRELISYYANGIAHLCGQWESEVRERDALPADTLVGR